MINFRYHVVSLTAVFLALAIGLVVGTAALNGPVADSLSDNVNALRKNNEQLRETVNSLEAQVQREEEFVIEAAPIMVGGRLEGRRIVILALPSGQEHVDGVTEMLATAGATVTGRIDIQDKFVNPDNSVDLLSLAARAAPPTPPANGVPGNSDGVETSSALLAGVLLDRTDGTTVTAADRTELLEAYQDAGYLTASEDLTGSAEAVVVVSGQPYVDRDAAKKDSSVVRVVEQFDKAGVTVVAGSGSNAGNLVAAVRGDPALSRTISTVDNANTPMGQVSATLATIEQLDTNRAGQYGLDTPSLLPPPAE
ncbi:copper transporter [Solwaraspora sp. WMMD1047]|uniref:copper transporter n=1 Tax=Solwaraspora sp. WMMD1047 TaxID=3016102 RepID=UPI002416DE4D|nr:copper transporter [Solwaraspora sp. WMMD1047]MDG4830529.1 copper transporter [Solwaraspora sp. WMMD1047]